MAQVRSRQSLRSIGIRILGLCALAVATLAGPATGVTASGNHAQAQLAAVSGAFDDWSPSGRSETPPRAAPAPTPQPIPNTGGRLGYRSILGLWCSPGSRYKIERTRLIVILNDGRRVTFPITRYIFKKSTIEVRWLSSGVSKRTIFGRFSANRRRMVQFGVNRTYNRC